MSAFEFMSVTGSIPSVLNEVSRAPALVIITSPTELVAAACGSGWLSDNGMTMPPLARRRGTSELVLGDN